MKFMGTKEQGKKAHKSARSKPHNMVHNAHIQEPAGKRSKYAQAHRTLVSKWAEVSRQSPDKKQHQSKYSLKGHWRQLSGLRSPCSEFLQCQQLLWHYQPIRSIIAKPYPTTAWIVAQQVQLKTNHLLHSQKSLCNSGESYLVQYHR